MPGSRSGQSRQHNKTVKKSTKPSSKWTLKSESVDLTLVLCNTKHKPKYDKFAFGNVESLHNFREKDFPVGCDSRHLDW